MAERTGLNPVQSRFESEAGYRVLGNVGIHSQPSTLGPRTVWASIPTAEESGLDPVQ